MPAKSEAQRRWAYYAEKAGIVSPSVAQEFEKGPKGKKLPERVKPKKKQT